MASDNALWGEERIANELRVKPMSARIRRHIDMGQTDFRDRFRWGHAQFPRRQWWWQGQALRGATVLRKYSPARLSRGRADHSLRTARASA